MADIHRCDATLLLDLSCTDCAPGATLDCWARQTGRLSALHPPWATQHHSPARLSPPIPIPPSLLNPCRPGAALTLRNVGAPSGLSSLTSLRSGTSYRWGQGPLEAFFCTVSG